MDKYLNETQFMDYNSERVQKVIRDLNLENLSDVEKAIKLFYFVRDATKYSIKGISLDPDTFIASNTLQKNTSFCIPKAVELCTLGRAVGIPSRIHFVDFINHRLTKELIDLWGTNIMASHCYTELFLNEKWVKATPALDKKTCDVHDFITVDFDGINDALLKPVDRQGRPHVEYIRDHGVYDDVPLEMIREIFIENYGSLNSDFIRKLFSDKVETFKDRKEN